MKRMSLLALLLPALAGAQDAGQAAFTRACSTCHQAGPLPSQQAGKAAAAKKLAGPHLGELLQQRSGERPEKGSAEQPEEGSAGQLRAWISAPYKLNPKTQCDTRLLRPDEVDLVIGYLSTSALPPPPPRDEQLRLKLQQDMAELRRSQQGRSPETIETHKTSAQGKK